MAALLPTCLYLHPSVLGNRRPPTNRRNVAFRAPRRVVATAAPPAASPSTQPSSNGSAHMAPALLRRLDAALQEGHLDGALAAVCEAAAAAAGRPVPLLDPRRNRALIQACFSRGRPDKALAYLQLLHPRAAPWVSVLTEANKRRDLATAQRVLTAREAAGLPPDHRVVTAAIVALGGGSRLPDALATFCRAWEERECRTVEVANAAIAACAQQGNWEAAQEVVGIMQREGVDPDVITFNSLIKAAGRAGRMSDALAAAAELRAAGLRPTAVTYASLLHAAARTRHGDAEWMLQLFDEMVGAGVKPNDYVVSALFSAASHVACTPAQQDRLLAALALLRSLGPPNDTVYTSLLTLIQRQSMPERAADVWTAVKADGVRQTPHIFSSLFAACAPGASPALVEAALEAADAMQAQWAAAAAAPRPPRRQYERDMLVAHNSLLHFLGSAGQLGLALATYDGMRARGPAPDVVTYNTLIAAAATRGDVSAAMRLFSDMVDEDIDPTERTAGALLNCYAKARDAASARRVFSAMRQLGIAPTLEMYTSLMDACVQAGETEAAFGLLDELRRAGLAPSAVTYGCLLAACERSGQVDRAFRLYQRACDEGVAPTDQMHDMLIGMCTEADRLDDAVDLVKRLARTSSVTHPGGGPAGAGSGAASCGGSDGAAAGGAGGGGSGATGGLHEHTLNSLIRALCGKYVDRALRLLGLCQAMGLRPSRRTYLSLVLGCARASRSAVAFDFYRSLRAQGMDADGPAGSALIASLCRANRRADAETVYNDMLACAWRREHAALPAPAARRAGLSHRAHLPDGEALAALVQAAAQAKDLRAAAKYYKQLRRVGPAELAAVAASHRRMWEALIETYCRANKVKQALQVFDDWKAARDDWLAAQQPHPANTDREGSAVAATMAVPPPAAAPPRFPKLSTVSLAFLEACCRSEPDCEWRVYDVCAVMRQQKELKQQAALARPQKQSHHFAPA